MENQTTEMDYIQSFGRDWSTIITFAGPPLVIILIFIVIYLARRMHAKKLSALTLGDGPDSTEPASEDRQEEWDLEPQEKDSDRLVAEKQEVTPEVTTDVTTDAKPETSATVSQAPLSSRSETPPTTSWMERLRSGLAKTRGQLTSSIHALFSGTTKIDDALLDQIHEALYKSDMGVQTADLMVQQLRAQLASGEQVTFEKVAELLKQQVVEVFKNSERPVLVPPEGPRVILVIGVNGVGKTTTVGKLAAWHIKANKSVLLCAADTFRAAAIEQLSVWAQRIGVQVIAHKQGADPAAVAFDGVKAAKARNMDAVIIDTAGRLHNKVELMAELGKVTKAIHKEIPGAPHETWIVVDATTGQNAVQQVKAFNEVTPISGVIVTKLDGSAKGGIVVAIAHQFKLPIRFVGVGESSEDLRPFNAEEFASSLF
ncbi:MAG: signal recognition particle-docking protein FtsY [Pseudomonadota bacterium]